MGVVPVSNAADREDCFSISPEEHLVDVNPLC